MDKKSLIRKKYIIKRKKSYFQIKKNFFNPLIKILKEKVKNKKLSISLYYPTSFELNILTILDIEFFRKFKLLLPVVEENNSMNFYKWKKNDLLYINKYGIPEPVKSEIIIPSIILVPILAFNENKHRLGYGGGFYDRYLNKYIKMHKNILTVGVAFSFQKHHKLPVNKKDVKLNYILTEKGIIK